MISFFINAMHGFYLCFSEMFSEIIVNPKAVTIITVVLMVLFIACYIYAFYLIALYLKYFIYKGLCYFVDRDEIKARKAGEKRWKRYMGK